MSDGREVGREVGKEVVRALLGLLADWVRTRPLKRWRAERRAKKGNKKP